MSVMFREQITTHDSCPLKKCSELSFAIQQIKKDKTLDSWVGADLNSARLTLADQQIVESELSEIDNSMSNYGSSGLESSCSDETTLSPPLDDFEEKISPGRESSLQCRNWVYSQTVNKGRLNLEPVRPFN